MTGLKRRDHAVKGQRHRAECDEEHSLVLLDARSIALFVAAAVAQIGGVYLV